MPGRVPDAPQFPDGLHQGHANPRSLLHRHASPISILLIGLFLAVALSGLLGGTTQPARVSDTPQARLAVTAPSILRNGMFYEAVVEVEAHADIADAVIAVSPSLWRRQTQNSMIPAAAEERFSDGMFRFSYGALAAGETLLVKADFQINPDLEFTAHGDMVLADGETELARIPLAVKVLP